MNWSRIQNHPLAMRPVEAIRRNGLAYHNMTHVAEMYDFLHQTEERYDEALDWAVLYHDVIYDAYNGKEHRSALLFHYDAQGVLGLQLIADAEQMILVTEKHFVTDQKMSAIVRADLHGLASPVSTIRNYVKALDESLDLYDIDEQTFASNNITFMTELTERIMSNIYNDPDHAKFYRDVIEGIALTRKLSAAVKGPVQ